MGAGGLVLDPVGMLIGASAKKSDRHRPPRVAARPRSRTPAHRPSSRPHGGALRRVAARAARLARRSMDDPV